MIKLLKILKEIKSIPGIQGINWAGVHQIEARYRGPGNDYLNPGQLVDILFLGKYATFLPYGTQDTVLLFPGSDFDKTEWNNDTQDKNIVKQNIEHVKNLINQGQYKIIT